LYRERPYNREKKTVHRRKVRRPDKEDEEKLSMAIHLEPHCVRWTHMLLVLFGECAECPYQRASWHRSAMMSLLPVQDRPLLKEVRVCRMVWG
jgi:hypothetical protein